MNRNKFLVFVIVALLISNVLLVFMLLDKHKYSRKDQPENRNRNVIIEKLGFDKEQIVQYDEFIAEHRRAMKKNRHRIKDLKTSLYKQINTENTEQLDSIKRELSKMQLEFEMIHYHHFKDIKGICREDQLESYNDLLNDLSRMFGQRPPRKGHRIPKHD